MGYLKAEDRLGLTKINNNGTEMKIIKILPDDKVIVRFQDEFACTKEIHWNNFKSGNVMNPYDRKNVGVGYIGEGKYKTKYNNRNTRAHNTWNDMLSRCYSKTKRNHYSAYIDCTVCDEWHNFQVFAKWYEDNFYDIGEGRMHLDKDILVENNRIYSPKTCIFVPQRINMIFMQKPNKYRLPNGISLISNGKYHASYNTVYLGTYDTLEEAMIYYNEEKIIHIREVADEYKGRIPKKLYDALYKFNGNML